jgi:hypothetical protein
VGGELKKDEIKSNKKVFPHLKDLMELLKSPNKKV